VLVGLLVVLLVVIGGVAYAATRTSSSPPATTVAAGPSQTRSPAVADAALAASINLRTSDLPAGWGPVRPTQAGFPTAPPVAQAQAARTLSSCLGSPYPLVAGLFGSSPLPGASGSAASPVFQLVASPGFQMSSSTSIQSTVTDNQVLTGPFASPHFATCFAAYQSTLAAAAVPGATATVQPVTLAVPAGVRTFAYLTTYSSPTRGSEVKGEAWIFGGRSETQLVPTTAGPPVPQAAFASAYDSITARVAKAATR